MSEMVERVALESYPYAGEELAKKGAEAFGGLVDENFIEAARAAIAAMREPTDDMVRCGLGAPDGEHRVQATYRAMIDAALKP